MPPAGLWVPRPFSFFGPSPSLLHWLSSCSKHPPPPAGPSSHTLTLDPSRRQCCLLPPTPTPFLQLRTPRWSSVWLSAPVGSPALAEPLPLQAPHKDTQPCWRWWPHQSGHDAPTRRGWAALLGSCPPGHCWFNTGHFLLSSHRWMAS